MINKELDRVPHVFHPNGPYGRMGIDVKPKKAHRLISVDGLARKITFYVPNVISNTDEDEICIEFDCGAASIPHIDYTFDGDNWYQLQHGVRVSFPIKSSRKIWLYFHNKLKWYIDRTTTDKLVWIVKDECK